MKRLTIILFAIMAFASVVHAQGPGPQTVNAKRIYSGTAVPTQPCSPGPSFRDVYIRTTTNVRYQCTAAPNTWTPDPVGTVTSVTGTANQVNSTGGATPVLSLSSTIVAPGTLTVTTSTASPFFVSTSANPADASAVRLGNAECVAWEKFVAGTDWTLCLNASDELETNANMRALGFIGPLTGNVTGNVSGSSGSTTGNAATVTLNANLSGAVVSSGSNVTTPGKADVMQSSEFGADAGANDTYVVTLTPALTAYVVGTKLRFFANTANTGAASVNFNSLGALAIKVLQGTADPANGDIKAGAWVDCTIKVGSICEMTSTIGNAPAAGITNSAGANVVPKSDGTNLVASLISDDGFGGVTIDTTGGIATIGGSAAQIIVDDTGPSIVITGPVSSSSTAAFAAYKTASNCTDSAGAAACGSAAAGSVVIDAGSTSVVVSTTAVTADSQIFAQYDSSLGTRLGVTCNVTVALPVITARTEATSFTMTVPIAPVTNKACFSFFVVN